MTRAARLVVGALATLALLTGAFVVAQVAFVALYVGVPLWVLLVALALGITGLVAALRRMHRSSRVRR